VMEFKDEWWNRDKMPRESLSHRRLWVYAVDPSMAYELDTAAIHRASVKIRWEGDEIKPGPVGEYLEVIDFDPASGCFYPPINLSDENVLAQGGLRPSEGNPQFHQQMVYAVAMNTIQTFEKALGRRSMWARHTEAPDKQDKWAGYVKRLRVYPHALRDQNAYYDPQKIALLFGYFSAADTPASTTMPGGTVFTCLSFDIITHETTHALLDGLHPQFTDASNVDVLAFHEAFADIVALFQHFTLRGLLAHQIAKTRGDLATENLLAELAQQFGRAIGGYGALRDAIGGTDEKGKWRRAEPTGRELEGETEPHNRGAVLVGALFDAFVSIYNRRTKDLIRLASGGSGILTEGALHPDLVNRLAGEAAKSASHVLNICVRALDYCPPVDITFGDYLRALITADFDLWPDDDLGYRIAFIEAFRRRGIYPLDVRALSEDSLRWRPSQADWLDVTDEIAGKAMAFIAKYSMKDKRGTIVLQTTPLTKALEEVLIPVVQKPDVAKTLGLNPKWPIGVGAVRPSSRTDPDGDVLKELMFEVHQAVQLALDPSDDTEIGVDPFETERPPEDKFIFRGGSTVVVDLKVEDSNYEATPRLRYCISKNIDSVQRRAIQRDFLIDARSTLYEMYFDSAAAQPFALLHRGRGGR
jgi:hypothetical protein